MSFLAACLAHAELPPLQEVERALRESTPADQRQQFDDLEVASRYWYESRNPANLPDMDKALARVLPMALKLAPQVKDFAKWEEGQFVKPYHYAGAILLAKAYTLLYYGRVKEAAESVRLLEEKLPYSMMLVSNRDLIWTRRSLRYHQHACALYGALVTRGMEKFAFPEERDEFDEAQQVRALEDQVILRLREGDMAKVEHLFSAIQKTGLKSTAGKWMEDIAFTRMGPLGWEVDSAAAWDEILAAIKRWQKAFPKSENARVAEAAFHINHAYFQLWHGKAYSDYRGDVEPALDILGEHETKTAGWFTLKAKALAAAGRPIDEVMLCAKENLEKFPDHAQPLAEACLVLAGGNAERQEMCGQFLHVLCQQPNKEVAARILKVLARRGLLEGVKDRLDPELVSEVVIATGEKWSQSLSLRNEFADLCVQMGQRDTARLMLAGIEDHWSHDLWGDRRDVLQQIVSRKARGESKMGATLAAVKFEKWLPEVKQ